MALATTANVTVRGGNMAPTAALACIFRPHLPEQSSPASAAAELAELAELTISVAARFVSVEEVSCVAPHSAEPMSWSLSLTTDGATASVSEPALLFTRYEPSRPTTIAAVLTPRLETFTTLAEP
jgi:hypothetical protein